MTTTTRLADFDAAIAWEGRDDDGFIPVRAEVMAIDHVRRVCAGAVVQPLATPVVFDDRFTFTHVVRSPSGGAFLLAPAPRPESRQDPT